MMSLSRRRPCDQVVGVVIYGNPRRLDWLVAAYCSLLGSSIRSMTCDTGIDDTAGAHEYWLTNKQTEMPNQLTSPSQNSQQASVVVYAWWESRGGPVWGCAWRHLHLGDVRADSDLSSIQTNTKSTISSSSRPLSKVHVEMLQKYNDIWTLWNNIYIDAL